MRALDPKVADAVLAAFAARIPPLAKYGHEVAVPPRPTRPPLQRGPGRRQPPRHRAVRPHPAGCRGARPALRHRDPAPRPRLRQRPNPPTLRRGRHRRPHLRSKAPAGPGERCHQARAARAALADRAHQLVAVQLRTTPPQHRPSATPPTGSTRTRHRLTAHRQTHRLARSMEPTLTPYPLKLLLLAPAQPAIGGETPPLS